MARANISQSQNLLAFILMTISAAELVIGTENNAISERRSDFPAPPLSSPLLSSPLLSSPFPLYVLSASERRWLNFTAPTGVLVRRVVPNDTIPSDIDSAVLAGWAYPEGSRYDGPIRVFLGHLAIWRRIAEECERWCLVSEDDAIWADDVGQLDARVFANFAAALPEDAKFIQLERGDIKEGSKTLSPFSAEFDHISCYGNCAGALSDHICDCGLWNGGVAYALTREGAKLLLQHLPSPGLVVDHYLWKTSVKVGGSYLSKKWNAKHGRFGSLKVYGVSPEDRSR